MTLEVKICGLGTQEAVAAAVEGGARMTGFVFFPPSPRSLSPGLAGQLMAAVPADVTKVGLLVDADDDFIDHVLAQAPLDLLQLHGAETPRRVRQIKERFQLPVMKALSIAGPGDVVRARGYLEACDRLLFDAKPPEGATRPGGNALAFDWALLAGETWTVPWMLAGGLDLDNLAEAVEVSGATAIDVSSGVEDAPGVKNVRKIKEFLAQAAAL